MMFRYLMVIAVALGSSVTVGHAQYARIKIDLNNYKVDPSKKPAGPALPGGFPGGFPGGDGGMPGIDIGGGQTEPDMEGDTMPGDPGGSGQPGYPGGGTVPKKKEIPPVWLTAHIPVKNLKVQQKWALVYHDWGSTIVPVENIKLFNGDSVPRAYKMLRAAINRDNKKTKEELLAVAEFCLQHGLLKEFADTMKELGKKHEKLPAVIAFTKVHEQLQKTPKQEDPNAQPVAAKLAGEFGSPKISAGEYYSLYTKLKATDSAVTNRLNQLDRTYKSFFYWFALRGKVLPIPNYRLVVVLEDSPKTFISKHVFFHSGVMKDGGFTAQRNNVVFLSETPIDSVFTRLADNNQSYWKELRVSQETVLKGAQVNLDIDNKAKLQTLALIQKAVVEEEALTTTTHEAVRQLLAATDLLPRNVMTAEWLRYGIASFFETPRNSFYECTALPSWTNLVLFKHHRTHSKEIADAKANLVLFKVISDRYFSEAQVALELAKNDESSKPSHKIAKERVELAHATAWALTYYLMNHELDKMFNLFDELKNLPRDAEYSPNALAATFGKAFGLASNNPNGPANIDMKQVQALSEQWYGFMGNSLLEVTGVEQLVLSELAEPEVKKKKTNPKNPFQGK